MPAFKKGKRKPKEDAEQVVGDQLDAFVARMNKEMKGVGRIDRGRDIAWLDPVRIRTGILGLDVVSNGGYPRGGCVQQWGPFSSGKTTTALQVMIEEQRRGANTMLAAGEGFNKPWARQNGLWIPHSDKEYEDQAADVEMTEWMKQYDQYGKDVGWGDVFLAQHIHGDGLLEVVAQAVKANLFSIQVVDSLAILRNQRSLEETEVGQETMGGGGQIGMFNSFMARVFSALNTKYSVNDAGNTIVDMNGAIANNTCVVCINQARSKMSSGRPGQGPLYQPPGGEMLRHSWHFSVQFSRGEMLGEDESIDGDQKWQPYGRVVSIRCDKSKIGPEGRTATWDLYLQDRDGFEKGHVDRVKMVRVWGVYYGVIEQGGAWFNLPDGTRIQGKDNLDGALREAPELCQMIEDKVIEECRK